MYKFFILIFIIFSSFPALSYIDPGLGSIFVQFVLGTIAVSLSMISIFWQKIKNTISKLFNKKKKKSK